MLMDVREYIDRKDTEIAGQPDPLIVQRGTDAVGD